MKKLFSLLAVVFTLGLSTVALEAEAAKRLGGGQSLGAQRQAAPDKPPGAPPANATPAAVTPAAGAATAGTAAASSRSWMGPVAGIAAGLGLAALASHLGFGEELASIVLIGLLAAVVAAGVAFVLRRRADAGRGTGPGPAPAGMRYATVDAGAGSARASARSGSEGPAYKLSMPPSTTSASAIGSGIGAGLDGAARETPRIAPDFDRVSFERHAKANFIRLQAAHDAGDLEDIRAFTTPELYAELVRDAVRPEGAPQPTEVLELRAEVIEALEEAEHYRASVRFSGRLRYPQEGDVEDFDEIWNLSKARNGAGGWLLSGIQQVQGGAW